jgi:DNA-binding XRE family transcriptional regulator
MSEPKITLKAARVNADMTQDEATERIGKSKQTIVNWETGKTEIKYSDLISYRRFMVCRYSI